MVRAKRVKISKEKIAVLKSAEEQKSKFIEELDGVGEGSGTKRNRSLSPLDEAVKENGGRRHRSSAKRLEQVANGMKASSAKEKLNNPIPPRSRSSLRQEEESRNRSNCDGSGQEPRTLMQEFSWRDDYRDKDQDPRTLPPGPSRLTHEDNVLNNEDRRRGHDALPPPSGPRTLTQEENSQRENFHDKGRDPRTLPRGSSRLMQEEYSQYSENNRRGHDPLSPPCDDYNPRRSRDNFRGQDPRLPPLGPSRLPQEYALNNEDLRRGHDPLPPPSGARTLTQEENSQRENFRDKGRDPRTLPRGSLRLTQEEYSQYSENNRRGHDPLSPPCDDYNPRSSRDNSRGQDPRLPPLGPSRLPQEYALNNEDLRRGHDPLSPPRDGYNPKRSRDDFRGQDPPLPPSGPARLTQEYALNNKDHRRSNDPLPSSAGRQTLTQEDITRRDSSSPPAPSRSSSPELPNPSRLTFPTNSTTSTSAAPSKSTAPSKPRRITAKKNYAASQMDMFSSSDSSESEAEDLDPSDDCKTCNWKTKYLKLVAGHEKLKKKLKCTKVQRNRLMQSLTSDLLNEPKTFTTEEGFPSVDQLQGIANATRKPYCFVRTLMQEIWPNGFGNKTVTGQPSRNSLGRKSKSSKPRSRHNPREVDGSLEPNKVKYLRDRLVKFLTLQGTDVTTAADIVYNTSGKWFSQIICLFNKKGKW